MAVETSPPTSELSIFAHKVVEYRDPLEPDKHFFVDREICAAFYDMLSSGFLDYLADQPRVEQALLAYIRQLAKNKYNWDPAVVRTFLTPEICDQMELLSPNLLPLFCRPVNRQTLCLLIDRIALAAESMGVDDISGMGRYLAACFSNANPSFRELMP